MLYSNNLSTLYLLENEGVLKDIHIFDQSQRTTVYEENIETNSLNSRLNGFYRPLYDCIRAEFRTG